MDTAKDTPAEQHRMEKEDIEDLGTVTLSRGGHVIHCLTVIGQIEGHTEAPQGQKTTKYEHVIPQLVAVQEDPRIEGLLVLLNTVGGDVEAGLAIAELIRSMQALNFDGKAMLIVPNSFLFANRTESMKVRKWLLQSYSLEAIISLPEDTFMYSGVRSGVMVFSKPFMSGGWEGHTQRVLYYNLEKQEDKEKQQKEYERLEEVWSQRDSYYGKWERSRREKTVENRNGIKVPANWQYNSFWFADVDQIEAGKWNLLPENYRPEEQINLEIEDPALLLQEMLKEQEEITKELFIS